MSSKLSSTSYENLTKEEKKLVKDYYKSKHPQTSTMGISLGDKEMQEQAMALYLKDHSFDPETPDTMAANFYNILGAYDQSIRSNLMLNPNDANALAYKQNMYGALDQYQATADASLAATEMSAYAMLGQQQLELESTIAEQRMKALKSGTTSAQLASQQLANMFAAQSGAAQIANNMMQTRMSNANQFAQSRYGITQDMYNMINANQQTYANAQAQLGAIAGSYASTINQPYAQYDAYERLPDDVKKAISSTYTFPG